jgi:hypothetical protein
LNLDYDAGKDIPRTVWSYFDQKYIFEAFINLLVVVFKEVGSNYYAAQLEGFQPRYSTARVITSLAVNESDWCTVPQLNSSQRV